MICNYFYLDQTTPQAILGPVDAAFSVQLLEASSVWITTDSSATIGANDNPNNGAALVSVNNLTVIIHEGETLYAMAAGANFSMIATPIS